MLYICVGGFLYSMNVNIYSKVYMCDCLWWPMVRVRETSFIFDVHINFLLFVYYFVFVYILLI